MPASIPTVSKLSGCRLEKVAISAMIRGEGMGSANLRPARLVDAQEYAVAAVVGQEREHERLGALALVVGCEGADVSFRAMR